MNIMGFNNEDLLLFHNIGEFAEEMLHTCLSNTDDFIENLDTADDRAYNTENIKPRISIE